MIAAMVPNTAAKASSAAASPWREPASRADEPGSGRVSGARISKSPRWPLASLASAAPGCRLKVVSAIAAAAAVAIVRLKMVRMFALDLVVPLHGGSTFNLGAGRGAIGPQADYIFAM